MTFIIGRSLTNVELRQTVEITSEKRKGKFLLFFPITWWEITRINSFERKYLHITTNENYKDVYVNKVKYSPTPKVLSDRGE